MRPDLRYVPALCLSVHAGVVCVVLGFTTVAGAEPTSDANIGLGFGMLCLAVLGLPWSAVYLAGAFGEVRDLAEVTLFACTAVFNLVLHGSAWIAWDLVVRNRSSRNNVDPADRAV